MLDWKSMQNEYLLSLIKLTAAMAVLAIALIGTLAQAAETASPQLGDLLAANHSAYRCESDQGVFYLDGSRVRADFVLAGLAVHLIVDGDTSYTWLDGFDFGLEGAVTTASTETLANLGSDFVCASWLPEAERFVRPGHISFNF